ncbi:MAG: hypothetical protein ACOX2G_13205, partial [Bacillota bacterium]
TERLEIILYFFRLEANRVGKKLVVRKDVLKALMSGEKPGNVGQIKSDVQVACARGFLNHFGTQSAEEIVITLRELSSANRSALLGGHNRAELEKMLPEDRVFYPGGREQKAHLFPGQHLRFACRNIHPYRGVGSRRSRQGVVQ